MTDRIPAVFPRGPDAVGEERIRDLLASCRETVRVSPLPYGVPVILRYREGRLARVILPGDGDGGETVPFSGIVPLLSSEKEDHDERAFFSSLALTRKEIFALVRAGVDDPGVFLVTPRAREMSPENALRLIAAAGNGRDGILLEIGDRAFRYFPGRCRLAEVREVSFPLDERGRVCPEVSLSGAGRTSVVGICPDEWRRLRIGPGDTVLLSGGGEVVERAGGSGAPYEPMPGACPSCGFLLAVTEGERSCVNPLCAERRRKALLGFGKRLGIPSLDLPSCDALLEALDRGRNATELSAGDTLGWAQLAMRTKALCETGISRRRAEFISAERNRALGMMCWRDFVWAMDIWPAGPLSGVIADIMRTPEELAGASLDDFRSVPGMSRARADRTFAWIQERRAGIAALGALWKKAPERRIPAGISFAGAIFSGRDKARKTAREMGFHVLGRPGPTAGLIVLGPGAGTGPVEELARRGAVIISEPEWLSLVRENGEDTCRR